MAIVAQLVRAPDCGSGCRGFDPRRSPFFTSMHWIQAFILGVIQGLTEFFPVSSSAHLKIVKELFNQENSESTLLFDLFCHLGTSCALLLYFRKEIWDLLHYKRKTALLYCAALLPLVPCYFLLKPVREWASHPSLLGYWLMCTAGILFIAQYLSRAVPVRENETLSLRNALFIGTAQALALIPGISRSASTISTARLLGRPYQEAVHFSFLLSIPAILGGIFLESVKIFQAATPTHLPLPICVIGGLTSFSVGIFTVSFALRWLSQGNFKPFAWYCALLGIMRNLLFDGP